MKKLLPILLLLLCMAAMPAQALTPTLSPTPECTPAPTATPEATRVPDMIAMPDGETRPVVTATPRPTDAPLPADPFMANAIEIARRIDLLAESSLFIYSWDYSGATQAQLEAVSGGDHTNPVRVYEMTGEGMLEALSAIAPEGSTLPDLSRAELRRDLVNALPDMLLGDRPDEELSLIHLLWRYKVFACEGVEGCGMLLMLYEGATPVALTWYADQGAVSMSACFMPDDALAACQSAEEAAAWFAGKGLPAVTFEEVEWQ